MKGNEILDAPNLNPIKKGLWSITIPILLLMTFSLLLKFPLTILVAEFLPSVFAHHLLFIADLILIALPFYFFIKKIDCPIYHPAVIFVWASLVVCLSEYLVAILNDQLSNFYGSFFPYFVSFSSTINFSFDHYFLEYGFTMGGFTAFGIYFLIKDNNRWLLPLIGLALWILSCFFNIPYIISV